MADNTEKQEKIEQIIDFSSYNTKNVAYNLYKRFMVHGNDAQFLVMPTGTGKTAVAVATAGIVAHKMKTDINLFIIAPKAKLEEDSWRWTVDQYNNIAKYKLHIYEQSTPEGITYANKNNYLRKMDIKAMPKKRRENLKILNEWHKDVTKTPTFFIIDEAHMFKNGSSKRTRALVKLTKGSLVLGLSATPMSNGYVSDGIGYLLFNRFYSSKSAFEKEHIPPSAFNEYYQPQVYLPNGDINPNVFMNLDLFLERIYKTLYNPPIRIDFDMPDTNIISYSYDIDTETHKIMKKCHKDYRERRYDNYMEYLYDLRNAIALDMNHRRTLAKVLLKYKPKQPLIFYYMNTELEGIEYTLQQLGYNYSLINGQNAYSDVNVDDTNQAIVIQYSSGASAIEFKKSDCSIFYGLQYSWQDTKQAFGRNVRRGMTGEVNHIFTVATSVYDNKIFEALSQKSEFEDDYKKKLAYEIAYDEGGES